MKIIKMNATCDYCDKPAVYDTKTVLGHWAYCCEEHYEIWSAKIKYFTTRLNKDE